MPTFPAAWILGGFWWDARIYGSAPTMRTAIVPTTPTTKASTLAPINTDAQLQPFTATITANGESKTTPIKIIRHSRTQVPSSQLRLSAIE